MGLSGILSGSWTSIQPAPWVFSGFSLILPVRARWGSWRKNLQNDGNPTPEEFHNLKQVHTQVSSNSLNIPVWFSYPLLWCLVASVPGKQVLRSHASQRMFLSRFWNSYLLCKLCYLFSFQSVQISFSGGKHWKDNLTALYISELKWGALFTHV